MADRHEGMHLTLRPLTVADEAAARTAHEELAADDFEFLLEGPSMPWPTYVARLGEVARGEHLAADRVPMTFLGRGRRRDRRSHLGPARTDRLAVALRRPHRLRRAAGVPAPGVCHEILRQSLEIAREHGIDSALVICDDGNAGSAGAIERSGGVLEQVAAGPEGHGPVRRYWVPTA